MATGDGRRNQGNAKGGNTSSWQPFATDGRSRITPQQAARANAPAAARTKPMTQPTTPAGGGRTLINSILDVAQQEADFINNFPGGAENSAGGSGYGYDGGGGSGRPAPVALPRMADPHPWLVAKLAYDAVATANAPFDQAVAALDASRTAGQQSINDAGTQARTAMQQDARQYRQATAGLDRQIGAAYERAMASLAGVTQAGQAALTNRGFAADPTAGGPMGVVASMGAAAQEANLVRRQLGEQAIRESLSGANMVTQAGLGTLSSAYASVLGNINTQRAQAIAAVQRDQQTQYQALLQEIARINHDTAIQEAMANR